jgi:phenylpropionate dioxygenase-like ring-hydroxylating dioxygenase large terminal subunit
VADTKLDPLSMEEPRSASGEDLFRTWPRYRAAAAGLRNYWYPVMFSRDLRSKPVSRTICGEKVFIMRDKGKAYALKDRCPHRGVPLSYGNVEAPGTITCAYHGWTYDIKTGDLVAVLTDGPDSPIVQKRNVCVPTYPVEERGGIVFVYVGDEAPPPVEADIPDEVLRPNTVVTGVFRERKGNWRFAIENGFDEGHANYLHRRSWWTWFRVMPAWREATVGREGDWLVRVGGETRWFDNYPRVGEWPKKPYFYQTKSRGRIRGSARLPGWIRIERSNFTAFEVFMGVDADHHRSLMFLTQQATGLRALAFKAIFWLWRRWAYMGDFNAQDQWMIESMQIPPERLYRPDASITAWRKLIEDVSRGGRGQTEAALAAATEYANRGDPEKLVEQPTAASKAEDKATTGASA